MVTTRWKRRAGLPALGLLLAALPAAPGLAQEGAAAAVGADGPSYDYCVACTAPQAIYVCTVGPRQPDPGARVWGAFCAERARTEAGHRHCSSQPLTDNCKATRALVFRGTSASRQQAEALTSSEPERRASAAEQIWNETLAGMRAVGSGVEQSAEAVGRGAGTLWQGMVGIGSGVARGAGCVLTLGWRC